MRSRILITEDDRSLLGAYRALLGQDQDLAVDFAETPQQAHKLIEANQYDAALFDIQLSDVIETGFDLLSEINRLRPGTPVLMMSSLDDEQTVARCKELGAAGFAPKDLTFLPNFTRRIHGLLDRPDLPKWRNIL